MNNIKIFIAIIQSIDKLFIVRRLIWVMLSVFETIINIYILYIIFNVYQTTNSFQWTIFTSVVGFIFIITCSLLKTYFSYKINVQDKYISDHLYITIFNKFEVFNLQDFQNPRKLEHINKIKIFAQNMISRVVEPLSDLIVDIFTIISSVLIVKSLDFSYKIIGILLAIIILSSFFEKFSNKYMILFYNSIANEDRKYNYYFNLFRSNAISKDVRSTNIANLMIKQANEILNKINISFRKFTKNNAKIILLQLLSIQVQNFIIYVYMGYLIYTGSLSTQQFIAMYTAVNAISLSLTDALKKYVSFVGLEDFCKTVSDLEIDNNYNEIVIEDKKEYIIEFIGVYYRFSEEGPYVINNLNMSFKTSEQIAIVGSNGSGKSTIIKLLLKQYLPTKGVILIDGIDINKFDNKSYYQIYAVLLQEFSVYCNTLEFNLLCSTYNKKELKLLVENFGIDHLQYNQNLTNELESSGINLSGGEKQKVGIIRAFIKKSKIRILDEPTSALDPISEEKITKFILENSANHGLIMVLHKMNLCSKFNRIILIDEGTILEDGPFDLVYNKSKLFKDMYDIQKVAYINN